MTRPRLSDHEKARRRAALHAERDREDEVLRPAAQREIESTDRHARAAAIFEREARQDQTRRGVA